MHKEFSKKGFNVLLDRFVPSTGTVRSLVEIPSFVLEVVKFSSKGKMEQVAEVAEGGVIATISLLSPA